MKNRKEILLEDDEILMYLENDLTEERAWRVEMALQTSPRLRKRLWQYQWLKEELTHVDSKSQEDLGALHEKIMKGIDGIEFKNS